MHRHPDVDLLRRRRALFALFGLPGLAISSWVARTPDIRDLIQASTEQMGLVLFGVSAGAMLGILASAGLLARFGARTVTTAGMTGIVASMPVVGLGADLGEGGVVAAGLFLFGLGMGGSEIAVNSEGAAVEQAAGASVLPAMHGCFSLGTVVGALLGVWCNLADIPVVAHLLTVGAVSTPVLVSQVRRLSPQTGLARGSRRGAGSSAVPQRRRPWRDPRLLLIGVIVLAMALAEGAATDWLPLVMVDGHGASASVGAVAFAAFATAMTVGRFAGGPFLNRYGRVPVLRVSAMAAVAGIGCVSLVGDRAVASVGVLLWGLGVSLGFPVAMSAAGDPADSDGDPAARVSLVATMGYLAFLVGPPSLGVIGQDYGLRLALLVPLGLLVLTVFLAPALGQRVTRPEADGSARTAL